MIQEKRGDGSVTRRNMQKILEFVEVFHETNGYSPTLSEIAVGIGKRAEDFGNVQPMVRKLIKEGFLVSAGKNAGRSLGLAKNPPRKVYYEYDQYE